MEAEFSWRCYRPFPLPHSTHMRISTPEVSLNSCLLLPLFQNANCARPPIKALDGVVNKNVSDQDQIPICIGVMLLIVTSAVYSSLFFSSQSTNTDTHTHNKTTGSLQNWPGLVWPVLDPSGECGLDPDPCHLFSHWTTQPVCQVSINTPLRSSHSLN